MKRTYHIAVGLVLVSGSLNAHPGCAVETRRVTTQVVTETVPAHHVAPAQPVAPVAPAASNKIELAQSADFDKHIQNNKNVIVAFTTTWCGPCKTLKPVLDEIKNENRDVTILIVDGDKFGSLVSKHAPQGFPTLKFFKDGKEVAKIVGGETKEDLQSSINQHFKGGIPVFETVTAPEAPAAPAPAPAPAKAAPAPSVASGNRIELGSSADFDAYLAKGGNILAVFSTTWCGPCKALKPVLEELVSANKNVTFVFVDGDRFPGLVQKYSSTGFPTLKYFKNGKDVGQQVGGGSKSEIQNMISSKFGA